jgi:hypothetical protein
MAMVSAAATVGKLGPENRRFARVRPFGLVPKNAKIVVGAKLPAIDCDVIDLSAGGACLFVSAQVTLPKRFMLLHGKTKKNCLVVWNAGRRLGVAF